MTSKGLGKILALGAGLILSGIAENVYSQNLKPGDKLPSGETYQGPRKEIIEDLLKEGKITENDIDYDEKGLMIIKKKNKTGKETAGVEKKVEEKKAKEIKKKEKRVEVEKQDKRKFGIDIKGYIFSDTDANKSRTTGLGIGCGADAVAFKKLRGLGIGTYATGKVDCIEALSSYGSDSTSKLDSLSSKFNVPLLMKIKKGFYLGFGAQLENIIASIYAERSDNTIAHNENYSGGTANLLIACKRINLNAYFGSNISGSVEDRIDNISVKRDVNGSSYGMELIYRLDNKKKIITEIEGGKKGDYTSSEIKLGYVGKDNRGYGVKTSNVSGNNYNNSQLMIYLSQRFGRK